MLLSICAVILSLHFGRVLAGNLYRASPAFVLPAADLARTLGYFTTVEDKNDDGSITEKQVEDVSRVTKFERLRFYCHILLAN